MTSDGYDPLIETTASWCLTNRMEPQIPQNRHLMVSYLRWPNNICTMLMYILLVTYKLIYKVAQMKKWRTS